METNDYSFLSLLSESQLASLLDLHPTTASALKELPSQQDERQSQRELMARKRAAERDLRIPLPEDASRRNECLSDPVLFLQTYFGAAFFQPFTEDRRAMLQGIINAAMYGGDSAIAGPRGEGKTRLAIYGGLYLMVSGLSPFPMVIGKSQKKSENELKTIKERLQQSELFIADFPEIGVPFKAVGGWSSRARMQTVAGENTNMELAADHIIFPTIRRDQLPSDWPDDVEPVSCGQMLASMGVDGPIRGTNYRDKRPTLALIDDIEDKEAAKSETIIARNEEIIEHDIGGLGGSGRRVSRIMLCTIQNRKCIAYKYTDPKQKPSWNGRRYRKMVKPPDRMDMVETYLQKRIERKEDDPDAREAFRYWRDNQRSIESGCVVSNVYSYDKRIHADGEPLELSAIQAYYNNVADRGADAVATEDDNDPPESVGPQGMGLTAEMVASRVSGLDKMQLPANATALTAAIDLGKYRCHWVVAAWWKGAGGCIVDYGVAEVTGTDTSLDHQASEPMIYKALLQWRDELLQKEYVDAAGQRRTVDSVFVDSGTFTNAAYEFVRQVGPPFYAAKGVGKYKQKTQSTEKVRAGDNMHAARLDASNLWLFELNTDYWKQWVHERFMTPTFDESNMLRRGSLSLFVPPGKQRHSSYAQHVVSEELVTEFKEGKGAKTFWTVHNPNNHWLDATYYAAAAGRYCGISLLSESEAKVEPRHVDAGKPKPSQPRRVQHGASRFRTRPGGWVKGLRK